MGIWDQKLYYIVSLRIIPYDHQGLCFMKTLASVLGEKGCFMLLELAVKTIFDDKKALQINPL